MKRPRHGVEIRTHEPVNLLNPLNPQNPQNPVNPVNPLYPGTRPRVTKKSRSPWKDGDRAQSGMSCVGLVSDDLD